MGWNVNISYGCFNPKTDRVLISYAGYDHVSVSDPEFTRTAYYKATSNK